MMSRAPLVAAFGLALAGAGYQQLGPPPASVRLEVTTEPRLPARIYLFKNKSPFRLFPVQAVLPIKSDTFYRDRLWKDTADPGVMEVIANDEFHYILLKGHATFHLPPGSYRMEAYRGMFYTPAIVEFELRPGETHKLALPLKAWAKPEQWLSADDHIHLTRARAEDPVYLGWLEAEDLNVANFLQLERQVDAAPQYAFGRGGQSARGGYTIRPGQESRNEFYGHILMLGVNELIRPMSTGAMYANTPESYPHMTRLFELGRKAGGTLGYAHFRPNRARSTVLMDLALGKIDFVEMFQFGVLTTTDWYELLNAGFRVTGVAGSDFPVPLNQRKPWPRWLPLLGPERALVRARAGADPYETWAAGVRAGEVVVTNGPLVEVSVDQRTGAAQASASFFRPIESIEIISNGEVIASARGDGSRTTLSVSGQVPLGESCWVAARTVARKLEGEPDIQAHTSPVYMLRENRPVHVASARRALADRWRGELAWLRSAGLVFGSEARVREFFDLGERALATLDNAPK